MAVPKELKYSREHEWVRVEGNVAVIGITDHAQEALGEVVYLELPAKGEKLAKDAAFGVVESTKAVSDIYAPVSGTVTEVNSDLIGTPERINKEPYEGAWLVKVTMDDSSQLSALFDAAGYETFLKEEA